MSIYSEKIYACIACNSSKISKWRSKDCLYKTNKYSFDIFRCDNCGTNFLNPPPSEKLLKAIYSYSGHGLSAPITLEEVLEKEKRFPNSAVDAKRIVSIAHELNSSGNKIALDIGSGYGFYTKELKEKGYAVTVINPGSYENAVFKAMNGEEPRAIMFEDFETDIKFGIILMSQVLEHIVSPCRVIKKAYEMLHQGGALACAVPNVNSFNVKIRGVKDKGCLWVPEHANYFTVAGLETMFSKCGFKVLKYSFITKIPYDLVSKRILLPIAASKIVNVIVKYVQKPFNFLMDKLGYGLYINIYARKE